ncbi:TonB-dependent siderophore receptor [Pseudomonas deceptionensis]|uniref:Metal-pseudopaline receptor CntO n=1 Tax=Pseudomonas deceptionensis TaxID=882211 RepID=A0A0J6GGM5_PSEDM|nr:TonB-dependent siderophore receptor [Pseudomonas deceptionensis]KMM80840.1 TonB-dependent receptor [Pseudomonas deceptionensis]SEE89660.1 iron complex outermembrane recepter protein [Pseudomonas deceptionensis]
MPYAPLKPCLLALTITLGIAGHLPSAVAEAMHADQGAVRFFDLPPAPLGVTLSRIARDSNLTLSVAPALLQGKTSAAVNGMYTPQQAAERALVGCGLGLSVTDSGALSVYPQAEAGALNLGATTVSALVAEDGRGHVDGFVATRSATATKTDTPILEIPQTINVVTTDQVEVQGARDLTQALRYTPGLSTNGYTDRNTIADEITSRGFAPTLLYLDGAYLPSAGSLGGTPQIDPYTLERIEVLKGPSSVLYGQNQPGGMINMVSKRPSMQARHEIKVGTGSFDRYNLGFDFTGPLDDAKTLGYRLIGVGNTGSEQVDYTEDSRMLLAPSFTWAPDDDTELTLYAQLQRDDALADYQALPAVGSLYRNSRGNKIDRDTFLGDSKWNDYKRDQYVLGYQFTHAFNETMTYRQSLSYIDVDDRYKGFYLNRFVTAPDGATDTHASRTKLDWRQQNSSYSFDNHLQSDFVTGPLQHTLLVGLDYRSFIRKYQGYNLSGSEVIDLYNPSNYRTTGVPTLTTKWDNRVKQTGFYVQDQIKLDNFILTIGGRQDWAKVENNDLLAHSRETQNDNKFTGRVGLTYVTSFGLAPYISYTESFLPSVGTSAPARGGKAFAPMTGKQYEVGVKYQPNDTTLLTASVFEIKQQNVLTGDLEYLEYQVQEGEVSSRGIELEGKSRLGDIDLIASLSYLDVFYSKSNYGNEGNRSEAQAPWAASVWADYHFTAQALKGVTLGGGARYTGKNFGDSANTFKTPSFVVYDATLSYDLAALDPSFKGVSTQLNVQNLFDREYVSSCNYSFGCYYGQQRTAALEVKYDW